MATSIQATNPTIEQVYKKLPPPPQVKLVGVDDAALLCILGIGICATIAICQVNGKPITCNLNDFPKLGLRENPKCLGDLLARLLLAERKRNADEAAAIAADPAGGYARTLIITAIYVEYAAEVALANAAFEACKLAAALGIDF